MSSTAERQRLVAHRQQKANWKNWGPYLSERAWGTVREDYSKQGTAWDYFPHDHARSRAYRWNEDGLAGISDRQQFLCFALALWNGREPILKERLFGLTGPEGNHGEDVKEAYFYTDSGQLLNLGEVAAELAKRLTGLFLHDEDGKRPFAQNTSPFQEDPHWRDLLLFHEYFANAVCGWGPDALSRFPYVLVIRISGSSSPFRH